jgi:large subunit ribosomal protein L18
LAKSSNYRVKLRRRREGKTDYQARKALVISGRPRLVVRTSLRNVNAQIIIAKQKGDQVLASANSRELVKKYGWRAPAGNIPAAYLTGLLVGLKAKAVNVDGSILDIGLITPTKGARIFAVLKGVVDAGVEVPHSEEKIVKDRLKGDHISLYAKSLSADSDDYKVKFSKYNVGGVVPEKVAEHFSKVRAEIVNAFKGAKVAPEPESAPEPKPKAPKPAPKPEAKHAPASRLEAKVKVEPKAEAKAEVKPTPKSETKPVAESAKEKVVDKVPKLKEKVIPEEKAKIKVTKEGPEEKTEKAAKSKKAAKEKSSQKKSVTKVKASEKDEAPKEKPAKKGVKKA